MIQSILAILVAIWLAYGLVNVTWGLAQILFGLACGVAAMGLYTLAYTLELVCKVIGKLR
jgi:hypothetical protein